MQFPLYVILVTVCFGIIKVKGDEAAICLIWNDIEQRLNNENFSIKCTKSNDCYSLNCTGAAHGYDVSSKIHLHACEDPPYAEFEVDVPKLNVNNIMKKIYHNDTVPLTRNLNVEFQLERRNNHMLMLGLFVNFLNNGSFPLLRVPMRIPVISNTLPINCSIPEATTEITLSVDQHISVVTSPPTKSFLVVTKGVDGYSNCSITNSTCSEEEICQQIDKLKPDGICVCISNYTRNEEGKCVLQKVDESSVSFLLTAILIPMFVIMILLAVVYTMFRFRVFQHLRRRLRVQVYEHVLLGEDEEEDVTNPVA